METIHYKDANDIWFMEIRSNEYHALKQLEFEHKKLNRKTWFNLYNSCQNVWVLTIEMNPIAVAA